MFGAAKGRATRFGADGSADTRCASSWNQLGGTAAQTGVAQNTRGHGRYAMNQQGKSDRLWVILPVVVAVGVLLFGDNLYERFTGHPLFGVSQQSTSNTPVANNPTSVGVPSPSQVNGDAFATSMPVSAVRTCKDILAKTPNAGDGDYTLFVDGQPKKPFTAYCHNMHTTPLEYLPLVHTGRKYNFSRSASGGARSGLDVISQFEKLRIDPLTLIVDPTDLTFSTSSGKTNGAYKGTTYEVITVTFATAASCVSDSDSSGTANIDLSGTPFVISELVSFSAKGWNPAGKAIFSNRRQVVDITGGGYCGDNSPSTALKLEYDP